MPRCWRHSSVGASVLGSQLDMRLGFGVTVRYFFGTAGNILKSQHSTVAHNVYCNSLGTEILVILANKKKGGGTVEL